MCALSKNSTQPAPMAGLQQLRVFPLKHWRASRTALSIKKHHAVDVVQEEVRLLGNDILAQLQKIDCIDKAGVTGLNRRGNEIVTELEFVVSGADADEVRTTLAKEYSSKIDGSDLKTSIGSGFPVSFKITGSDNFVWNLHQTTGSEAYLNAFNAFLNKNGYHTSGEGLYKDNTFLAFSSEEDLYSELGLQYVPPELRESERAIMASIDGNIPKLIENKDLIGMLHVHTSWSDGENTIREMALKARDLGFSYIAICDHSHSAGYANGLTIERIALQHKEIDSLNKDGLGIDILKGIESDILKDGSLDYPDDILSLFDVVVASVHSGFKMTRKEMTDRLVKAVRNPYTNILGHPTGRLLLVRPAYEVDIKHVIDIAADHGKIIEINSNPYRLDLDWENVIYGKDRRLHFAINPDSHRQSTLEDVYCGVTVARKGWLEAGDVVNTLEKDELLKLFHKS